MEIACKAAGLGDYTKYVKHNKKYDRLAEVDLLIGDPTKAKKTLGWSPSVSFEELVALMVEKDIEFESKS